MIICRTAEQCGQADYGWLQARYTFSFGHYFDPELLGFASLRVLNQEVLKPGSAFQPRTYPQVDILNILLQGEAEYRDSNGCHIRAKAGDVLLLAAQPAVSYSEHSISDTKPLTRLQLWFNACPSRENSALQRLALCDVKVKLLASPEGENGSLQLRQQVWVHHLQLDEGETQVYAQRQPRLFSGGSRCDGSHDAARERNDVTVWRRRLHSAGKTADYPRQSPAARVAYRSWLPEAHSTY